MTPERWFELANYSVMPAWALLAFAPRWSWTQRLVHSALYPCVLGVAYVVGILLVDGTSADLTTLAGVSAGFAQPKLLVVGWVHYLVFDLFVGAWQARDAQRRGIPHLLLVPCLALTLMLGPAGLLLYLAIRFARTRIAGLAESGAGA
jgi:hypothetical protein